MADHYETLGVSPDATKDEIRAAYRAGIEDADSARRAQLNRAWNVLSDPVQRGRYDEALESGDVEEEEAVAVPARRTTGARRGSESAVPEVVDDDDAPPPPANRRPTPERTIPVPDGMVIADVKTRSFAMVFDVSVLLVIFLVVQFIGVSLIENQYPKQTDRVDALIKQVDKADEAKSDAEDAKDKAQDKLDAAKKDNDSSAEADAQEAVDRAQAKVKTAEKNHTDLQDELTKEQNELRPMYLLITAAVLVLALLYTIPMSARTGQTVGKRLRKVRLVRIDGSPAGWGASAAHYGLPIVLALALSGFLGPLALVLGLGMVLWNIRDRNRQGLHDKLAKTFVVEA